MKETGRGEDDLSRAGDIEMWGLRWRALAAGSEVGGLGSEMGGLSWRI